MIIRKATLKDFEELKKLWAEFFLLEASTDERVNTEWVKQGLPVALGKSLRNKNEATFVAEEKGKLVGYASSEIIPNSRRIRYEKQGHLYNLYVIPRYRGKNIGKRLLEKSLDWFKKRKVKDLKIMAYEWNKRAQKLYRKYGFRDYMLMMMKISK